MSYTIPTQEDITESQSADGLGCKWCDSVIAPGTAVACTGDIYCWDCGLKLSELDGTDVRVLPTRYQAAELARWSAAGIGAN